MAMVMAMAMAKRLMVTILLFRKRTISAWAKIAFFAALASSAAWGAANHSIAMIMRNKNPLLALKFISSDPVALNGEADILLASAKGAKKRLVDIEELAKKSVEEQALNPRALRILGNLYEMRGDTALVPPLMQLSHQMSRRNFGTQYWLATDKLKKNDVNGALQHLTLSLTTTPESRETLFPILATVMAHPEVADNFAPYIKSNADWVPDFIMKSIEDRKNLVPLADLIIKAKGVPSGVRNDDAIARLILALAQAGEVKPAADVFRTMQGAPLSLLTSAEFTPDNASPKFQGLGWSISSDPSLGGYFDSDGAHMQMILAAAPGKQGNVARKPLLLPAGSYKLSIKYNVSQMVSNAEFGWEMRCTGGPTTTIGKEIIGKGKITLVKNEAVLQDQFIIVPQCEAQYLDLSVSGGADRMSLEIVVNSISIAKAK